MAKITTFNDILLKSVELTENEEGNVFGYLTYALKDEDGKIWETKRYCLENFNKSEIKNIQNILKSCKQKIKVIEKI